ncbi:hypothetical protein [Paenibacillus agricola]|uniref:Uncharacterized protein n=1 Tax=Paenibacillus agricola TaxID=2716264 RepID=A0ABX0JCR0_9BACL|nr:hypothetical protein [Paenibacillus agricola]NHN34267.1 hypothetical protein [Paenibacillus agricola]
MSEIKTEAADHKPQRSRKIKEAPTPDYLSQFDLAESPHLSKMSISWQRLYAAVARTTKRV